MRKTFKIFSLGCRTNQAEIEEISEKLIKSGFSLVLPHFHSPALVLINTCVVTQKAERETRKEIRKLRRLYPKSFLVILGCAVDAQRKLKIDLPEADLFVSNEDKPKIIELLKL